VNFTPLLNSPVTNAESTVLLSSSDNSSPESIQANTDVNESIVSVESTVSVVEQSSSGGDAQSAIATDESQPVAEEPAAAHNLVLTFIETCWVDIRDSNDKRLAYKSYYAGDELNVSNDVRLNVFLGKAINKSHKGNE